MERDDARQHLAFLIGDRVGLRTPRTWVHFAR
jgi:hypothetical protein